MKSSDLMEIELSVGTDANGNAGYVGVGFSLDDMMGSKYFINATTSLTDGKIYCSAVVNITGAVNDGRMSFDAGALYYLLMANGPTSANGLLHHVHDVTSAKPMNLSNVVPSFDTDSCGILKGCFLAPNSDKTPSGVAVSYHVGNDSFIYFELVAPTTSKYGTFVAVTFSFDGSMSIRDSYFLYESAVFQDGQIYCKALVNVQGSPVSNEIFAYTTNPYVLVLTTGNTDENGLLPPTSTYTAALAAPLYLNEANFDNSACNVEKSCVLPDECYRGCNGMGLSYKILPNSMMKVELFSVLTASNQYVAVGFSEDNKMGNDHVIECSALSNQKFSMKFSYNNDVPENVRISGEESIESAYFTDSKIVTVDGELYCSAIVNVSGWAMSDKVFTYNPTKAYYLLLASGFTDEDGL
ncbi:unnamed protein product [Cylicostephanus goldi]|uniref:DOMON domain-containing protein n=1 Tax=Cylicostephanus goldi TaxID=71465 RepID=A0A3P7MAG6_CYLGO|nr:unnamed protein product [Cylicostephanus goldi]